MFFFYSLVKIFISISKCTPTYILVIKQLILYLDLYIFFERNFDLSSNTLYSFLVLELYSLDYFQVFDLFYSEPF